MPIITFAGEVSGSIDASGYFESDTLKEPNALNLSRTELGNASVSQMFVSHWLYLSLSYAARSSSWSEWQ